MIQSHSFYKYVICVALKSHRTRFNLGCPVYPKVLFPPLSVYRPINLFWKHNTKWLSNLLWQILQHRISCPFVRLSSFLPIIDVILLVYIRKNLVFFANAWWPWSKIWKYLERIPSNNTPLVSCHLKSKLQFFLPIMMEAHILKESKYLKVSWDPLSVTKMSVCLSVTKNDNFQGQLRPPVSNEKCLFVCHEKWSLPYRPVCLFIMFYPYFRTNYRR